MTVFASGLIQGLGAELVFAAFRYRRWNLPVALLAGTVAGLFGGINDAFIFRWFPEYTMAMQLAYVGFMTVSGLGHCRLAVLLRHPRAGEDRRLERVGQPQGCSRTEVPLGTRDEKSMETRSTLKLEAGSPETHAFGKPVSVTAKNWGWRHAGRSAPALQGLNLEIPAGQRVLLAGASGAGKSTLLYALAGVLHEDDEAYSSGELCLDGRPVAEANGMVGLMQQDPETQVVQARVGDDVAFGAENLSVPPLEIQRRIIEALDAVGLDVALDHPTGALSGGQKQRLALAGILAMGPGLVLLDEPTANLDPAGVLEVRDAVIKALDSTGATLVIVEHRLEAWAQHMDRVIVLEPGGGVAHDGSPQSLFAPGPVRDELINAGVWVPGYSPLAGMAAIDPAKGPDLILAEDLAVARKKNGRIAAKNLDLTVTGGGAWCVRGANGAGKSTFALTLGGLLPRSLGPRRRNRGARRRGRNTSLHVAGRGTRWTHWLGFPGTRAPIRGGNGPRGTCLWPPACHEARNQGAAL